MRWGTFLYLITVTPAGIFLKLNSLTATSSQITPLCPLNVSYQGPSLPGSRFLYIPRFQILACNVQFIAGLSIRLFGNRPLC